MRPKSEYDLIREAYEQSHKPHLEPGPGPHPTVVPPESIRIIGGAGDQDYVDMDCEWLGTDGNKYHAALKLVIDVDREEPGYDDQPGELYVSSCSLSNKQGILVDELEGSQANVTDDDNWVQFIFKHVCDKIDGGDTGDGMTLRELEQIGVQIDSDN